MQEYFKPGSAFALRELHTAHGLAPMRRATFYAAARLDGLAVREQQLGLKLVELFEGRADRLTRRAATYAPAAQPAAQAEGVEAAAPRCGGRLHCSACWAGPMPDMMDLLGCLGWWGW